MAPPSTRKNQNVLPGGYYFSKVRREELHTVISRSNLSSTEETLAGLSSVALRYRIPSPKSASEKKMAGELIAWAFLSADASLTSLHVEPEHRGKGLAKAVIWKLLEDLASDPMSVGFRPLDVERLEDGVGDGAGWAHADVEVGDVESAGAVRGLWGKEGWRVRWVSVDLERVEMVVEAMKR